MPATSSAVPGTVSVVSFETGQHVEPGTMKTFELSSIIGSIAAVGIALAAVVIGSNANLRTEMRADFRAVETRLSAVEQRQARTEGLIEGLRDAMTARSLRDPPSRNESSRVQEPA